MGPPKRRRHEGRLPQATSAAGRSGLRAWPCPATMPDSDMHPSDQCLFSSGPKLPWSDTHSIVFCFVIHPSNGAMSSQRSVQLYRKLLHACNKGADAGGLLSNGVCNWRGARRGINMGTSPLSCSVQRRRHDAACCGQGNSHEVRGEWQPFWGQGSGDGHQQACRVSEPESRWPRPALALGRVWVTWSDAALEWPRRREPSRPCADRNPEASSLPSE